MARKSRRGNAGALAPSAAGIRVYRTAVYVRLSRDDDMTKGRKAK